MHAVSDRFAAVRRVGHDAVLRRLVLAFSGFSIAEHGTWLAVIVYAFNRGGVRESGLAAVALLLPTFVIAPLAAFAGDRFRPHRALAAGYGVQGLTAVATGVAMLAGAPLIVYATAAAATAAISLTRPVMGALLPLATASPADLIAANVSLGVIGNLGRFAGPLVAGGIIAIASPAMAFLILGSLLIACAVTVITAPFSAYLDEARPRIHGRGVAVEVLGGITALVRTPSVAAIVGLVSVGALAVGMFDVLVVVFADQRLGGGGGAAGMLAAAIGFGGLVGSGAALWVIGSGRLIANFLLVGVLLGVPLVALSTLDSTFSALIALTIAGMGVGLLSVVGSLAIQRRAPVRYRGRIFGALEGLETLVLAAGALAASALVDSLGLGEGLVVLGIIVMSVMSIGSLLFLAVAGEVRAPPADIMQRLQADAVLRHLELPALEQLAARVRHMALGGGSAIVTEGNTDDGYFLIVSGTVTVTRHGQHLAELGAGESFGEIAALRGTPRSATVTASSTVDVLVVTRADFIDAVNGHSWSVRSANEIADGHIPTAQTELTGNP